MRLTLRTLLAYMDNILEPKDAEDIGKKIEESEVATTLLHRARDVMRRLRLKAPDLEERGSGLDPNTVAEYLDNVLPDDRVPDFEKVCLESDMHLAEVASCHQILALVLGELAEVDPTSREHMYQLPQVLAELEAMETRETDAAEVAEGDAVVPPPPIPRRPKPIVPDYLREGRKRRRHLLPVAIALVLLVGGAIALGLTGQLPSLGIDPWRKQLAVDPFGVEDGTTLEEGDSGEDVEGEASGEVGPATPSEEGEPADQPPPAVPETPEETASGVKPLPAPPTGIAEPGPAEPKAASPIAAPPPAVSIPPAVPANVPAEPVPAAPAASGVASGVPGATEMPQVEQPGAPEQPAGAGTPSPPPAAMPAPGAVEPAVEPGPEAAPAPAESVGRFISDGQVLLRLDPATKSWTRLPAQGILPPDSELMSLPTFRPLIALTSGMTVQLTGATRIRLQPKSEQEIPELTIECGRMVVQTVGKPDTKLSLGVGGRKGLVTFVDPQSTLAIEMGRTLVPGANPETQPPPTTSNVYAVNGRILWDEGTGGEALAINAPGRITLDARPIAPATAEPLPRWLTADTLSQLDRWAAAALAESLQADRPVVLGLRELVDHRKKEVGRLAVCSLGCVGEFGPMLDVLKDRARKLDWSDYIEQLRSALALDPAAAVAIRAACENAYGAEGDQMFRMFWGYTDEQLAAGDDKTLVDFLDHDLLAFRVVSFWNLRQITGAGLYYEPEATPVARKQKIRAWKQRQEAGEIRHKPPGRP